MTLLCFLTRKEGTTREEFTAHWTTKHGPLVAGTADIARHIAAYRQYLPHEAATIAGMGTKGFDGVTVMDFETYADFEAFLGDPAYFETIYPDEDRFLDRHKLVWMVAGEARVVIDRAHA